MYGGTEAGRTEERDGGTEVEGERELKVVGNGASSGPRGVPVVCLRRQSTAHRTPANRRVRVIRSTLYL